MEDAGVGDGRGLGVGELDPKAGLASDPVQKLPQLHALDREDRRALSDPCPIGAGDRAGPADDAAIVAHDDLLAGGRDDRLGSAIHRNASLPHLELRVPRGDAHLELSPGRAKQRARGANRDVFGSGRRHPGVDVNGPALELDHRGRREPHLRGGIEAHRSSSAHAKREPAGRCSAGVEPGARDYGAADLPRRAARHPFDGGDGRRHFGGSRAHPPRQPDGAGEERGGQRKPASARALPAGAVTARPLRPRRVPDRAEIFFRQSGPGSGVRQKFPDGVLLGSAPPLLTHRAASFARAAAGGGPVSCSYASRKAVRARERRDSAAL